jgi:hypothetical protein
VIQAATKALMSAMHHEKTEEEWAGRGWDPRRVQSRGESLAESIVRVERGALFTERQCEEFESALARAIERPEFFGLDQPPKPPSRSPERVHKNGTYTAIARLLMSPEPKKPIVLIRVTPDNSRGCVTCMPSSAESGQREVQLHPGDWDELLTEADTMPLLDLSGPVKQIAGVPVAGI